MAVTTISPEQRIANVRSCLDDALALAAEHGYTLDDCRRIVGQRRRAGLGRSLYNRWPMHIVEPVVDAADQIAEEIELHARGELSAIVHDDEWPF